MQAASLSAALTAQGLACRRGDRVLFRGLSLSLESGAALQVRGANGTGKSSLLRILGGLLRPAAGTVERRGSIGLIDERPALDEHLALSEALEFWRALDGPNTPLTDGLADLADVPVRYLSTGQRKRAALARLRAQGAVIWLLDEPLNGLDTSGAAMLGEAVAAHCGVGGIAVLASHQPLPLAELQTLDLADFAG